MKEKIHEKEFITKNEFIPYMDKEFPKYLPSNLKGKYSRFQIRIDINFGIRFTD